MKRCSKCILPEGYPGIEFDEAGVCNYCGIYEKRIRPEKGRAALDELLSQYRGKGEYDCLVGVSGGRDSAYVLYYLVKECGLKPLAYCADSRLLPEAAMASIKRMVEVLDVPLIVEKHDYLKKCVKHSVSSWLGKPSPAMIPTICTGCRLGVHRGLLKCASSNNIPLLIMGDTRVETCFFKTRFLISNPFSRSMPKCAGLSSFSGLAWEVLRNPRYVFTRHLPLYVGESLYFLQSGRMHRLLHSSVTKVNIFAYIPWDEETVLETIRGELGWRVDPAANSTWRSDCRMSFLKNYLLLKTVGFSEKDDGLSNMVREGMITREEAIERLAGESAIPEKLITELLADIGVDPARLPAALESIPAT